MYISVCVYVYIRNNNDKMPIYIYITFVGAPCHRCCFITYIVFFIIGPTVTCPPDMEETLPLGVGEMLIKLGKINTNADSKHLTSYPAGVVDGSYKFKPGYTTVRLVASNEIGETSQCSFGVRILGRDIAFNLFNFALIYNEESIYHQTLISTSFSDLYL